MYLLMNETLTLSGIAMYCLIYLSMTESVGTQAAVQIVTSITNSDQ